MNLHNTEEVDLEVKPKNRQGGPASGVAGTWEAQTETGAFTVETDVTNPLKAVCKGNPQSAGDELDVGVVKFTGTRVASDGTNQPVDAQIAMNILPSGAETIEITAGVPREQA